MDERGIGVGDDPTVQRTLSGCFQCAHPATAHYATCAVAECGCNAPEFHRGIASDPPEDIDALHRTVRHINDRADMATIDRQRETRAAAVRIADSIIGPEHVRNRAYCRIVSTIYNLLYDGEIHGADAARIIRRWVR